MIELQLVSMLRYHVECDEDVLGVAKTSRIRSMAWKCDGNTDVKSNREIELWRASCVPHGFA